MADNSRPPSSSELTKAPTGIPGFDDIAAGGLPRGRTTLVLGGAGTGKTVFGLQTAVNGARDMDEPAIFLAFEENAREIRTNAAGFGWDIPALERDEKLFFVDAHPPADTLHGGAFDLAGTLATLGAKAERMGARRIVFDAIDVLLDLFDDSRLALQEMRRLRDWFNASRLTGIITARVETPEECLPTRHPSLLFLADCVILLNNRLAEGRVAVRGMRILKYRGSAFEPNEYPFAIGSDGIEVGSYGLRRDVPAVTSEKISTGIPRLDTMLGGGHFRASTILITGSPGTAKTTLAGCFTQAACRRKERALYIAFDESPAEIVRNLASVNIRLAPFIESGLLQVQGMQSEARSDEEHLIRIKALIEGYQPRCLVVDPLSALVGAAGKRAALGAAHRLIALAKTRGITTLVTSLLEGGPEDEASRIGVSTIADTWINLSYLVVSGERNRALSVIKARGIGHSNQVRELVLSNDGITLSDVYTAGGAVLMGTLRAEREAEERLAEERARAQAKRARRDLEAAEAEMAARIKALERELAAKREELAASEHEERLRHDIIAERRKAVDVLRHADVDNPGSEAPEGG